MLYELSIRKLVPDGNILRLISSRAFLLINFIVVVDPNQITHVTYIMMLRDWSEKWRISEIGVHPTMQKIVDTMNMMCELEPLESVNQVQFPAIESKLNFIYRFFF